MPESDPFDFEWLARRFDAPGVRAIAVMGSHARGDSLPHSDIDLLRLIEADTALEGAGSHLVGGHLVVVSDADPQRVETWFTRPEMATNAIVGVREARALIDRGGAFAAVWARACAFEWDAAMQERANAWAGAEMVGLIEEVHKGLNGLIQPHTGRLLNARFGLSWGLCKVMQVQRGVLLSGDNSFYEQLAEAIGRGSRWVHLRRIAFGIEDADGRAPTLREQVIAGLELYVETAALLAGALPSPEAELVAETVRRIRSALGEPPA